MEESMLPEAPRPTLTARVRNVLTNNREKKTFSHMLIGILYFYMILNLCFIVYAARVIGSLTFINTILFLVALGLFFFLFAVLGIMVITKVYKIKNTKGLVYLVMNIVIMMCCVMATMNHELQQLHK